MNLVEALAADGLVCVVGAGGKKSTLWALSERIDRAVVTASVRIPIFDNQVADVVVTPDPLPELRAAADDPERFPLGLVPEEEEGRDDRYLGYENETVADIAAEGVADAVLVKADGARMREFKAPSDKEPQLPASTDTVLPIASAHIVGKQLTEDHVHRPDHVAALTDIERGETVQEHHVADVLTSRQGGLKDVPDGARVVPVVNKVDDEEDEATARAIAERVLDDAGDRVDHVALTQLVADEPLVDVVS